MHNYLAWLSGKDLSSDMNLKIKKTKKTYPHLKL